MALTTNTLRDGLAVAVDASAAGRRKEEGAPRKEEVSFLAVGEGSPWRDKVVVAMAAKLSSALLCPFLSSNPQLLLVWDSVSEGEGLFNMNPFRLKDSVFAKIRLPAHKTGFKLQFRMYI